MSSLPDDLFDDPLEDPDPDPEDDVLRPGPALPGTTGYGPVAEADINPITRRVIPGLRERRLAAIDAFIRTRDKPFRKGRRNR